MSTHPTAVRDLDHVVMTDGRIYRVVGNLDHPAKFVGYNVYSPDPAGDRLFRSTPYRKNFTEDDELPDDALDTYGMLPRARICEHPHPWGRGTVAAHTHLRHPDRERQAKARLRNNASGHRRPARTGRSGLCRGLALFPDLAHERAPCVGREHERAALAVGGVPDRDGARAGGRLNA